MKYENFRYVPGTRMRLATVDLVGSFLWFKWKKTLRIMKDSGGSWRNVSTGKYAKGFEIEYLERMHNATAIV